MSNQAAIDFQTQRRRMMGIPERAGTMSNARPDSSYGNEAGIMAPPPIHRSVLMNRFGHVLSGGLKDKLSELDRAQSFQFGMEAPPRIGANFHRPENSEQNYVDRGGKAAALNVNTMMPANDRRRQRPRGPQQTKAGLSDERFRVSVEDPVALTKVGVRTDPEVSRLTQEVDALFGGGGGYSGGYRAQGPLMAERGHNTELGDGYITSVPFNPMAQIMNKVSARGRSAGLDYRELEEDTEVMEGDDARYLANTGGRQQYDQRLMQEMAMSMAKEMIKTVLDENKGKKYFKEVKTTHKFDNPSAKLIEMDGEYFRMDLKRVKLKHPKK